MTDSFEIKSADGPERVELKALRRDFILVTATGTDLLASAEVAHIGGGDGLNSYFAELAESWRGWSGGKTWRSHSGVIVIVRNLYRTGHPTAHETPEFKAAM